MDGMHNINSISTENCLWINKLYQNHALYLLSKILAPELYFMYHPSISKTSSKTSV